MSNSFGNQKSQRLHHVDLSRKGSVDEAIFSLVNFINTLAQYFTTSSCSGRIVLFENNADDLQKKGCRWLFVTHDAADVKSVEESLKDNEGDAVFKFEPMVMHIQCQSLLDAQKMHQAAVASGFRNSGITVGMKGKTTVAVRSTHGLEVPLSLQGELLVSSRYIEHLVSTANKKMEENLRRVERFFECVKQLKCPKSPHEKSKIPKDKASLERDCNVGSSHTSEAVCDDHSRSMEDFDLFVFDNT